MAESARWRTVAPLGGDARGSSDVAKGAGGFEGGSTARSMRGSGKYNRIAPRGVVKQGANWSSSHLGSIEQTATMSGAHPADAEYAAGERWRCRSSSLRESIEHCQIATSTTSPEDGRGASVSLGNAHSIGFIRARELVANQGSFRAHAA